ncbi:PEP-CTERM sorting domain-containing protein [Ferribacterium limneticum]|uniref:PEP-CTERM sorting domain-containing protein n=1 Tax=Ferribacterium limneticum TaxID=76259 RepID=UPI001CFAD5D1|nr:PEP-CTERM sorting domain-containing protein [Ferribacterium limneticum]UCV20264.1 PEP-CTERM sorting domain-containing protein [Ferribacterium limneticum]
MNKNTYGVSLLIALGLSAAGSAQATPISLTSPGGTYEQNFDTLAHLGSSFTNTALPAGWAIAESGGTRANQAYAVGAGSGQTGDTYSFGEAGSTERALGSLSSGTLIPMFGAEFINNTDATITTLDIAFTGELWRLGTAARTDKLTFQYSTDATSLTTGTYHDFSALDFVTPNTTWDGNAKDNFKDIHATIIGLDIAAKSTFWIRWSDIDAGGSDDGLAIDNFSLTAQGALAQASLAVPEPGSLALASIALVGLLGTRRHNRR